MTLPQPEDIWDLTELSVLLDALNAYIDNGHDTRTPVRIRRTIRAAINRLAANPPEPTPEPESYDPVPEMAGPPLVDLLGAWREFTINREGER